MENRLYRYSPIVERPPLGWPGGARLAFYVGLNIEHFLLGVPSTSVSGVTVGRTPDPLNHGWRDYGPRVGFWRILEVLDELHLRASVLLNSAVCERYPQVIRAGVERDWCWCLHGRDNSTLHGGFADPEEERVALTAMRDTVAAATGKMPRGWLGPALTETLDTPRLLAELGCSYVLDWCADDQPFLLDVPGMISVPYSLEINDIICFLDRSMTSDAYERVVVDQLEQLLADSTETGRVMALPLHPFVIGQPHRIATLRRLLRRIASSEGVWLTTSDEIAAHYLTTTGATSAAATGGSR